MWLQANAVAQLLLRYSTRKTQRGWFGSLECSHVLRTSQRRVLYSSMKTACGILEDFLFCLRKKKRKTEKYCSEKRQRRGKRCRLEPPLVGLLPPQLLHRLIHLVPLLLASSFLPLDPSNPRALGEGLHS